MGFWNKSVLNRTGRLYAGHTAVALNGRRQRTTLAADECACTLTDMNPEIVTGIQNVLTKNSEVFCQLNCALQSCDSQRIFRTHVNIAFVSARCNTSDHHAFQHTMRIPFHHASVHERAGVALVTITYDILDRIGLRLHLRPFLAGRETAASTSAQTGLRDLVDDLRLRHIEQSLRHRGL